jgi:hypothetical protein
MAANKAKSSSNNAKKQVTARAKAPAPTPVTRSHHPPSTRPPVEVLTQMCAQKASNARGSIQQEWFALGNYISQFRTGATTTEQPAPAVQAMGASA